MPCLSPCLPLSYAGQEGAVSGTKFFLDLAQVSPDDPKALLMLAEVRERDTVLLDNGTGSSSSSSKGARQGQRAVAAPSLAARTTLPLNAPHPLLIPPLPPLPGGPSSTPSPPSLRGWSCQMEAAAMGDEDTRSRCAQRAYDLAEKQYELTEDLEWHQVHMRACLCVCACVCT